MFTIDLADELARSGVTVNALHPATEITTMVRRAGVTPMSSVEEGAEAILNLAVAPGLEERSGRYFNGLRDARANGQAYDDAARQRLRAISVELTGLGKLRPFTGAGTCDTGSVPPRQPPALSRKLPSPGHWRSA